MSTLHAPANPLPTLVFALAVAIVWATAKVRDRVRRARVAVRREHERVTGWLPALRDPEATGPVILRDGGRIVLPTDFTRGATRGRHRADRLTSR